MKTLNPEFQLSEDNYLIMPQLSATLTLGELGEMIGSLAVIREEITRALDALISGIFGGDHVVTGAVVVCYLYVFWSNDVPTWLQQIKLLALPGILKPQNLDLSWHNAIDSMKGVRGI